VATETEQDLPARLFSDEREQKYIGGAPKNFELPKFAARNADRMGAADLAKPGDAYPVGERRCSRQRSPHR
jgi:hypothetical protein